MGKYKESLFQFETDSLIILATYTFAVYIVEVGLTIIYFDAVIASF